MRLTAARAHPIQLEFKWIKAMVEYSVIAARSIFSKIITFALIVAHDKLPRRSNRQEERKSYIQFLDLQLHVDKSDLCMRESNHPWLAFGFLSKIIWFYNEWVYSSWFDLFVFHGDKNNSSKRRKEIERFHPYAKSDELDILAKMYTDKELKDIAKLYGDAWMSSLQK